MAKTMHMKGPKIEGQRKPVNFPTTADLVDGLDEKIEEATGGASGAGETSAGLVKLYSTTGDNIDGAMTQAAMTQALQNKVGVNDTISSSKIIVGGGSSLQEVGVVKLYSISGTNTDGTITQAGITNLLNDKVGTNDTISSSKIIMTGGATLQESWNSGGGGSDTLVLSDVSGDVKVGETTTFSIATTSSETINVSSSDTSIATVSLSGTTATITGVAVGYTTITVTVGSLTATYTAIVSKTKVTIPTVSNTAKTYTGSEQSPTVDNEPSSTIATCTGKSGTNADDYTLTYTLTNTNRYEWADNTTGAKEFEWSIAKATVTVPTVSNTAKTYTGSEQSPTVENEPSSAIATCTGKTGTTAKDYTLSYDLNDKSNYEWAGGTTAAKTFPWSIAKAAGSLSVSPTSGTIYKGSTGTFTITTPSDGTITVTSGNTAIATVERNGNTVTITGVKSGTATITVSQAAGTNHNAPSNATYSATIALNVNSTLNSNSWDIISEVSQLGTGDTYWDVGDCKQITLNGKIGNQLTLNQNLCVFILHFNYAMNGTAENNIIWGGFKSALTSGKDVALVDAKYNSSSTDGTICFNMNHKGQTSTSGSAGYYGTNYGGWKGSDLRYDILGATSTAPSGYNTLKTTSNVGYDATAATLTSPKADTLLAALPSDLRSAMRLWTRWIDAVGNSSNVDANIKATVDAITLLTEFEVQGARTYANDYEKNHQTQMAYYNAGNSKVRYKHSDTSSAVYWWCASPSYSNSGFCIVSTSGGASNYYASYSRALAPAFKT